MNDMYVIVFLIILFILSFGLILGLDRLMGR